MQHACTHAVIDVEKEHRFLVFLRHGDVLVWEVDAGSLDTLCRK